MEGKSLFKALVHKLHSALFLLSCSVILLTSNSGFGQTDCVLLGSTPEANASTLRAVAFNADRFVAVGDSGIVVLSTNATNWLRQQTPTTSTLYSLTYGDGRFVAVGDAGCILQSTNGSEWSAANAGAINNLRKIAFGNGHFVVLTDQATLMRSADALAWNPSTNGLPTAGYWIYGLYFGGGLFVACGVNGTIYTSPDGLNWSNRSVSTWSNLKCGAYGNGVFITAGWGEFGADQVARSTNGVSWTTSRHSQNYNSFCFGNGLLVGVGGSGAQWSSDGITWTYAYVGAINCLSVAFGLGQYVVVGDGGAIFNSTNLSTWTQRNTTVCPIAALVSGNGVSVGISGNCGMIYSSEDEIHYIQRRGCGGVLTSIIFTNGLFVTAGSGGVTIILTSSDGTNWTSATCPDIGELPNLRFEQGVWVVAYKGIASSADGTNWILRVANPGYLTGLSFGNGRWVAFGWSGAIWSSPDGTNWVNCSIGIIDWGPITIQNGLFSLYGSRGFIVPPTAVVSRDGVQWFNAATAGPMLALHRDTAENSLNLVLAGEWGRNYVLRSSTNLVGWSDGQSITNTAGVTSVTITNTLSSSPMFFRAVAQ